MAYYLELDGKKVSRSEYCRRKGLDYHTVRNRMKSHNETFEQAVNYYENSGVKPKLVYLIECDGELISAKEYCRRIGLSYQMVYSRVKRYNETYE